MKERTVIIRGYGYICDPCICTFYVKTEESRAIEVIEKYLDIQTDCERERYHFEVRTADDRRSLFQYTDGRIYKDNRGENEPKDTRKSVSLKAFVINSDTDESTCVYTNADFEDEAKQHMDFAIEKIRTKLRTDNIYFEVRNEEETELLYCYDKDGIFNV